MAEIYHRKIADAFEQLNTSENTLSITKKLNKQERATLYTKAFSEIPIVSRQLVLTINTILQTIILRVRLENFPEEFLSQIYPKIIFYTDEIDFEGKNFVKGQKYYWKEISTEVYEFQMATYGYLSEGQLPITYYPLYMDASLIICNERIMNEIQHNKG